MDCPKCGAQSALSDRVCRHCGVELRGLYAVSPAARDQITPASTVEVPYAGLWRRVGAFAIDGVLLGLLGQALGVAFGERFATLGQSGRWIGFAIAAIYFITAHHRWGQTLGKRALNIQVVPLGGGPVTLSTASLRYVALAVPWFLNGVLFSASDWPWVLLIVAGVLLGSVLFVGVLGNLYLLLFNRPSRRLIHDWVAGTAVVRASAEREPLPSEGVRIKPVHVAIVGLIPVAVLAVLGWIAQRVAITPAQIADLRSAQAGLSQLPGVLQASLNDRHDFGPNAQTHVVSIGLWCAEANAAKQAILERQAVAEVLKKYPPSQSVDSVAVNITYGFDIGIASLWRRHGEAHSVADWRRALDGLSTR